MRIGAAIGIAAFAVGTSFAQPVPPAMDRALDCRNPQDAVLCREIQRNQAPGVPPGAYRAPAVRPAPTDFPKATIAAPSAVAEPFEGLWAQTKEECFDDKGPNSRTLIDLRNVVDGKPTPIFDQYENHCKIDRKSGFGDGTTLAVTCFEFWEYFTKGVNGSKSIIKLSPGRNGNLGIDGKTYQRCELKNGRVAGTSAPSSSAAPSHAQQPINVVISTLVSGGTTPTIWGKTNLPDGAVLHIWLKKPFPACYGHCIPASDGERGERVKVECGEFVVGPRWDTTGWPRPDGGEGLNPGRYILEIELVNGVNEASQPPSVQAVIGSRGEFMVGPLVGGCCLGAGALGSAQTPADAEKQKGTVKTLAAMFGPGVYYARYIDVSGDAPPPAR